MLNQYANIKIDYNFIFLVKQNMINLKLFFLQKQFFCSFCFQHVHFADQHVTPAVLLKVVFPFKLKIEAKLAKAKQKSIQIFRCKS